MKRVAVMVLCMLMLSGEAIAVCSGSIVASTPTADFIDNGNGTVTHTKTGLVWKRCSEGKIWNGSFCTGTSFLYTWQAGLQRAQTLNNSGGFATFTDWRVPNQNELKSIVERRCSPAVNSTIFNPEKHQPIPIFHWSSTPQATSPSSGTMAWVIYFTGGEDFARTKSLKGYVRLVRGGQ